jgi:toxin-antitoxin system PIN domain toxin
MHAHHEAARAWFYSLEPESVLVFCRQTQMGFFRLMTTEAVMGDEALTQRQCWALYRQWIDDGKAGLEDEPAGLDREFVQRTQATTPSPKTWTDAFLAAFAATGGLTLVTFDQALAAKARDSVLLR